MRVLITGSSGRIGRQLVKDLVSDGHDVFSVYKDTVPEFGHPVKLDLVSGDVASVISEIRPDSIAHLAAIVEVDRCETNPEDATAINTDATATLAKQAALNKSYFTYLSTSWVFDGDSEYTKEDDIEHKKPVNHYGYSKLQGEYAVMNMVSPWSILRTDLNFGIHPTKRNFLTKVYNYLSSQKQLFVPVDHFITPSYIPNLTGMIKEIVTKQITGIFHLSGTERISKYELAELFADKMGLDKQYLRPVSLSETNYVATRPRDSSLDSSRALSFLEEKPLPVEPAVKMFVHDLRQLAR